MDRSDIRVLVLDDEPFVLKLMARMLTNLGFAQVCICQSGDEALAQVDVPDSVPDLILCDLNMPQMDGVEFLRKLVEHRYEGSVILVSGEDVRALHATETLALAHGIRVLGALHKPVAPQDLGRLISQWTAPSPRPARPSRAVYSADRLREAIFAAELTNYYQPQVSLADGKVFGVEALVRWNHPTDGLVMPDQFVGVAEDNGLIDDLARVVLVSALAQARAWQDSGTPLRVAVNLSMENLASLDFPDFVAAQVAAAGVAPHSMVLELTESRLVQDLRIPLEILTRLRLKRFLMSIDDFGTGHSSLTQLRNMPFDELKIDRSFVHGGAGDETVRAIFEASLGLAQQLGMQTVAEGVEDRSDWDWVRKTGCQVAQGYFIAKPMPGSQVAGWLSAWNARVLSEGLGALKD
jgi:EAL domain-containing protein (putative c-di-GMP-specific phosphodiesterase class I)/DNA-binding NarL/FixJ family response regulator